MNQKSSILISVKDGHNENDDTTVEIDIQVKPESEEKADEIKKLSNEYIEDEIKKILSVKSIEATVTERDVCPRDHKYASSDGSTCCKTNVKPCPNDEKVSCNSNPKIKC